MARHPELEQHGYICLLELSLPAEMSNLGLFGCSFPAPSILQINIAMLLLLACSSVSSGSTFALL